MKENINYLLTLLEGRIKDDNFILLGEKKIIMDIVNIIKQGQLNETLQYNLLVELYKFMYFGSVMISIDPRANDSMKFEIFLKIKEKVEKNTLLQEDIDELTKVNELCLSCILDPLKLNNYSKKIYSEYPDAKF